jgi:23S rRNA (uracil1939-C5)-methyltransferase
MNNMNDTPQLIKNENYKVEFSSVNHEGLGVGRIGNFTIFVFGALPNEVAIVKLIKIQKNYGYGKLEKILKRSPYRVNPICPHYTGCGGCNLMHINYEGELKIKYNTVKETLERIGKFEAVEVNDVIKMDNTAGYRNKIQAPFGMENGKVIFGFFRKRTHDIIPIKECFIHTPQTLDILNFIKNLCNEYRIPAYNEEKHQGIIRHVLIRDSRKNGDMMVVLVVTKENITELNVITEKIAKRYPQVKSIILNVNSERTNVILGKKFKTLYGKDVVVDSLGGLDFEIGASSFYQVNPVQTEKLYRTAINYANLTGNEIVIDAYCGIGTIGLLASKKAKMVYGVEVVEEAIKNANKNAQINNITNVSFVVGKSEVQIKKWDQEGIKADVIFVDPPRKGCDQEFLNTIIEMEIPKVVYVSCNVATLARDLRILADSGYELKAVQPVDMFPHTTHVECVTLMSRVEK